MNGEIKDEEVTDALPEDLDVHGFVGPYQFPDNSRRRIPGFLYLFFSIVFFLFAIFFDSSPFTNWGYIAAAITLALVGIYHLQGGWKLSIDETDALVEAAKTAGFPVGHASAQMVWRGIRSRPAWRILLYSSESPPTQRGLVMIDAVSGLLIESHFEKNPETWQEE
ncbi:MAG TPA: hypothetical protein QF627_05965 [Acidimicrobiales bacterium]|nr:hypothetical protein [Acidimicrobiales bacterium]HJM38441.1 hypothetical protein [Acidimicrobiales bacterium]